MRAAAAGRSREGTRNDQTHESEEGIWDVELDYAGAGRRQAWALGEPANSRTAQVETSTCAMCRVLESVCGCQGKITQFYDIDKKKIGEGSYGSVCKARNKARSLERGWSVQQRMVLVFRPPKPCVLSRPSTRQPSRARDSAGGSIGAEHSHQGLHCLHVPLLRS